MADSSEQAIMATLAQLYGQVPTLSPFRSNNNRVYRATFAPALPQRVIKLAPSGSPGESILREQAVLCHLHRLGLDVPTVEFTQADAPSLGVPFFTMPLLPGRTLEQACMEDRVPWAEAACMRLGRFVHHIAAADAGNLPLSPPAEQLAFLALVRERFAAESMLQPPFAAILDHAERMLHGPGLAPIHGDYAWNQVVTDGRSFAVIDWESAALGHPRCMLARAIAMMREYGGSDDHIRWAVAGFANGRTLDEGVLRELHLWEMWHHIGCMGWKFVCGPEHRAHAFALARRVTEWARI